MLKKDAPKSDVLRSIVVICGILFLTSLLYFDPF